MGLTEKDNVDNSRDIIDEMDYVAAIKFVAGSPNEYDFLLMEQPYNWAYVVDFADYLVKVDFERVDSIQVSEGTEADELDLINEFHETAGFVRKMSSLQNEFKTLSMRGLSKALGVPIKIVFTNQTRMVRIFATSDDEVTMARYTDAIVGRRLSQLQL